MFLYQQLQVLTLISQMYIDTQGDDDKQGWYERV